MAASFTVAVAVTLMDPLVGFGTAATLVTTGGSLSTLSVAQAPTSVNELLFPASSLPLTHTLVVPVAKTLHTVAAGIVAVTFSVAFIETSVRRRHRDCGTAIDPVVGRHDLGVTGGGVVDLGGGSHGDGAVGGAGVDRHVGDDRRLLIHSEGRAGTGIGE